CFFFSSRRRHTRWPRDWSSDVCSSDLKFHLSRLRISKGAEFLVFCGFFARYLCSPRFESPIFLDKSAYTEQTFIYQRSRTAEVRSEERRVGKECRCTRSP